MLIAISVMPVSRDFEFRWRSGSKDYSLIKTFSGFQTFEWFLVLHVHIGTVVASGSHVGHNRATDVCDANVMLLEPDQYMACFDF